MNSLAALALLAAVRANPACGLPHGAVDLHVDLPFQVHYRLAEGVTTTAALRRGCVRTVTLSLFVPHTMRPRDWHEFSAVLQTAKALSAARGWAPVAAAGLGQIAVLYAVEGSEPLSLHLDSIPELVADGVGLFGLVHTHHNSLAESSSDPHPHPAGLSPRGARLVNAVYDAGGLIDVSHASDASFDDVAKIALRRGKPIIASHSNARAVTAHDRNLTDAQLRVIAKSGGLVGVAFHAPFLNETWRSASATDWVTHVLHIRSVMGPGHVAVGSDLDGLIARAKGLESHAELPALASALQESGVSTQDIAGILGGNAARVLRLSRALGSSGGMRSGPRASSR